MEVHTMRDYRGKSASTCDWVFGSIVSGKYAIDGRQIIAIITHDTEIFPHCEVAYEEIDPVTLGQCSDIYTMEENEDGDSICTFIYEGDIVEAVLTEGIHDGFSWGRHVVVFDRGAFCLKNRRGEITPMCNYSVNVKFKVLGNIHDNPELLEVTA